jgi:KaiC/GvpD/RAD55 family RecA-like ATPase
VTSSPAHPSTLGPVALANIQVDVTTRLGATFKPTATGFKRLDTLLAGGLRHGVVLALTGAPGSGRTSLALMMAYMAARASAGVVFASRGIDETEIVARLAARALRRSYPASEVTFGDILSGGVFANDAVKHAVNDALEAVVQKVGTHLHVARVGPECSLAELAERSSQLWARYERVLLVVDDIEGLAVAEPGPLDARVLSVAYALRSLADQGCAVVFTGLERHADLVSQAATTLVELHPGPSRDGRTVPLELVVKKNRVGGTGRFTVQTLFGATEFTEI